MTTASLAALLLAVAGIIHSYSFMCRKLPGEKQQGYYPEAPLLRLGIDIGWVLIATSGFILTFRLAFLLGVVAVIVYFMILPFILQPAMARMLGFNSLTDFVDSNNKENSNLG